MNCELRKQICKIELLTFFLFLLRRTINQSKLNQVYSTGGKHIRLELNWSNSNSVWLESSRPDLGQVDPTWIKRIRIGLSRSDQNQVDPTWIKCSWLERSWSNLNPVHLISNYCIELKSSPSDVIQDNLTWIELIRLESHRPDWDQINPTWCSFYALNVGTTLIFTQIFIRLHFAHTIG